jgi:protein arginine N-methyltransferase 1
MYERVFRDGRLMLADRVRVAAYQKAIQEVVKAGDIVADIGTGSGLLAFFAVQAGARKVYAVEREDIIEDAKKLAEINKLADKVVFIKGRSDKVELPEKVDVIVSETLGSFGLDENVLKFKTDARRRFLKPGGRLIPDWLELYLAPVESEAIWEERIGFWSSGLGGLDFSPVRGHAVSQRYITDCSRIVSRLAAPSRIAHISFNEIDKVPSVFHGESVIGKAGDLHGLVGYFRAGLSSGVVLSTAPDEPQTHWRQTFFPMQEAVSVEGGDEVRYQMRAMRQGNTVFWEWNTSVYRNKIRIAGFSQCDLYISKAELVVGRASFRPVLTQEGEIRRRVLDLCDGKRSIGEISELVKAGYPERYKSLKETMQEVVDIVRPVVTIQ